MTTIASTREGMAADSKTVIEDGFAYSASKIARCPDGGIAGAAGDGDWPQKFIAWCLDGRPRKRPSARGAEFSGLYLSPRGLWRYDDSFYADRVNDPFTAVGSGATAALAVLTLQLNRRETLDPTLAVDIACSLDIYSGRPVQVIWLKR